MIFWYDFVLLKLLETVGPLWLEISPIHCNIPKYSEDMALQMKEQKFPSTVEVVSSLGEEDENVKLKAQKLGMLY